MSEGNKRKSQPIQAPEKSPREDWENRPQSTNPAWDRRPTHREEPRTRPERDPRDEEVQTRERDRR